jgi:hypothetical protein
MSGVKLSHGANVLVRALIPIFGVAFLGWSGTKLLVVYFADSLASFYSAAMLTSYAVMTKSTEYQTGMKNSTTVGWRVRTGIKVALAPLAFVLVVGFFLGVLPLFVMLDIQAVPWREFLSDRGLYIAVGCQFAGAVTLLMNELDWVRTLDDPKHWFQQQVALLGARWGAMVLFGFFLSPLIALIYAPFLIVTYAVATVALELAPSRVLDLLARWTGRSNIAATKSAADSAPARRQPRSRRR